MTVIVFGLNHKTAPVELREKVAIDPIRHREALSSLLSVEGVQEAVLLSTCNRTEIYADLQGDDASLLATWLAQEVRAQSTVLLDNSYQFRSEDAARHLFKVAGGLDSLVLGETQILGQLKSAYASARASGAVAKSLGQLFEHAFATAKQIRSDTAVGANPVSVASVAVNLAQQLFGHLSSHSALLLGAGRTTELVAKHMREAGIGRMTIANRTLEKARSLCLQVDGTPALLGDLPDLLLEADVIISSTASQLPILGKGAVERALKQRKRRPFFMIDVAVPRDIEPQVAELDDVYLYTVDDLKHVIDSSMQSRHDAAKEAETLVEHRVNAFAQKLREQTSTDVLKLFRQQIEQHKQLELEAALASLASGEAPEKVLQHLAHKLTNKILHAPTINVKKAAAEGRSDVENWLTYLHDLDADS